MSGELYCARFIGGPSDGVITVSSAPGLHEQITVAVESFEPKQPDDRGDPAIGTWYAVYYVTCKRHSVEDRCLTTRYDYEFRGLEFRTEPAKAQSKPREIAAAAARLVLRLSNRCKRHFWFPLPEGRAPNDPGRRAAYRSARVGGCV